MMISFGAYDDDVYEFLQNNKNASALVRMLVRNYMRGENTPLPTPEPVKVSPVVTEPKISKEKVVETAPKVEKVVENTPKVEKTISNETNNRKKIQELSL